MFILTNITIYSPKLYGDYISSFETSSNLITIGCEPYFTSHSQAEAIMSLPFKWIDIPYNTKKKLKIICIGGIEQKFREKYGILGNNISDGKQIVLSFYQENNIKFIGINDLVSKWTYEN